MVLNLLSDRLRRVRVCCGDWSRILSSSDNLYRNHGRVSHPPYAVEAGRRSSTVRTPATLRTRSGNGPSRTVIIRNSG